MDIDKIKFRSRSHHDHYLAILQKMGGQEDEYKRAAAYLIALDEVVLTHVKDIFNLDECAGKPEGALDYPWQTETSTRTTVLLFDLWSGWHFDEPIYHVSELFDCNHAKYYLEAIKLRFPDYMLY